MNTRRQITIASRFGAVSFVLIALFWGGWYLINGSVPVIEPIFVSDSWTFDLLSDVPLWSDILFFPILVWLIVFLWIKLASNFVENDRISAWNATIMVIATLLGIVLGMFYGMIFGLLIFLITLFFNLLTSSLGKITLRRLPSWMIARDVE